MEDGELIMDNGGWGADASSRPGVATIGFFDGVHRGHRYLIDQVCEVARVRGLASVAVTFSVHPRKVMQASFQPELLLTCDEKIDLLREAGIDRCIVLDFTPAMSQLSARQFMALLKDRYGVAALVTGYDHRFGHNRAEGPDDYVRYGRELGMEVIPARAYDCRVEDADGNGHNISSSLIRSLLHRGDVSAAAACLGYHYFLQGTVVGGYRVGRTIGFPTANLKVDCPDKLVPADGVYAVRVGVDGREYGGMLCIGLRPTLNNGSGRSIEVNIFDFHDDIYGHPMRLSFVCRTRSEQKFRTVDELIARLHQDEAEVRGILARTIW